MNPMEGQGSTAEDFGYKKEPAKKADSLSRLTAIWEWLLTAKSSGTGVSNKKVSNYTNGKFNPSSYVIQLKGKDYLPVAPRIAWFRQEHPDYRIHTEIVEWNKDKGWVVMRATIYTNEGVAIATAIKSEAKAYFTDYLEKAETGAVGRALAMCGYGTLQAPEFEEGERLADSPIQKS